MSLIERIHQRSVVKRRARVLAARLAEAMPANASVIDVGCGDGQVASLIASHRPDLTITGLEVLVRPKTLIPVEPFDGRTLPLPDRSRDVAMLVDVLHHLDDPFSLLREAVRVARWAVVIKDHLCEGLLARQTLRWMDVVGNRRHGVPLPFNYWRRAQWQAAFDSLGLDVEHWQGRLGIYPWPATWWLDRSLHFVARLAPRDSQCSS